MYYGRLLRQIAEALGRLSERIDRIGDQVKENTEASHTARASEEEQSRIKKLWSEKIFAANQKTVGENAARQEENNRTQKSIKRATWAAFFAASLYGIIAAIQACEMREATDAATKSADAVNMELRPWVSLSKENPVEIHTDFALLRDGGASMVLDYEIANSGRSPATVYVWGEIIERTAPIQALRERASGICDEGRRRFWDISRAWTVIPGTMLYRDYYDREKSNGADEHLPAIQITGNKRPSQMANIGCILYENSNVKKGDDRLPYQTPFILGIDEGPTGGVITNVLTIGPTK